MGSGIRYGPAFRRRCSLLREVEPAPFLAGATATFVHFYPRLAAELEVPLVPFLLEGVGGEAAMNQADGIHPNEEGHRRTAENVLPYLVDLLQRPPP